MHFKHILFSDTPGLISKMLQDHLEAQQTHSFKKKKNLWVEPGMMVGAIISAFVRAEWVDPGMVAPAAILALVGAEVERKIAVTIESAWTKEWDPVSKAKQQQSLWPGLEVVSGGGYAITLSPALTSFFLT